MKFYKTLLASYLLLALNSYLVKAQLSTSGGETQINTATTNTQQSPSVAMDSSSRYAIVWEALTDDGDDYGIYAKIYNASGNVSVSDFLVNSTTANSQRFPDISMNSSTGTFVVVWQSLNQDGDGWGIYQRIYQIDGTQILSESLVNGTTAGNQRHPKVTMQSNGAYIVTWESEGDIYARLFNSNGTANGSEFIVNSTTTDVQNYADIASGVNDDSFVIVWQSLAQDGDGYGIYAQRYTSSGVESGSEFLVNNTTSQHQLEPSVTIDGSGEILIAWSSYIQDSDNLGIYARFYNSSGTASGSEFLVNTTTASAQHHVSVASSGDGFYTLAWEGFDQDGDKAGVYLQTINNSQSTIGAETLVNTTTAGYQHFPALATDHQTDGEILVLWQDGSFTGGYDIKSQAYSPSTTVSISNVGCLSIVDLTSVDGAVSSSDNFQITAQYLNSDITVTAPTGFEFSTDNTTFSNPLTISQTNGAIASSPMTVYARVAAGGSNGTVLSGDITVTTIGFSGTLPIQGRIVSSVDIGAVSDVRGNSLLLDGIGDYVETSLRGRAIMSNNNRTLEAWVKTSSTSNQAIISYGNNVTDAEFTVLIKSNVLSVETNGGGGVNGTTTLTDGEWHHIAVSFSGTNITSANLYVDGELESVSSSTAATICTESSRNLYIGNDFSNRYFNGEIDEVRIWSTTRTQDEIQASLHLTLNGSESGILAYYQFNENPGEVPTEPIAAYKGTLQGDATQKASTLPVASGTCYSAVLSSVLPVTADGTSDVNLSIEFDAPGVSPNGEIMLYELNGYPYNSPTDMFNTSRYWVIRNFGANTSGIGVKQMTFTLPSTDIIDPDNDPTIKLFKRKSVGVDASGSDGWNDTGSILVSANNSTKVVVFNTSGHVTSFSQFIVSSTTSPLPITLLEFTAKRISNEDVRLDWKTATEINNLGFEIESSRDGVNFEKIAFVDGAGNSVDIRSYDYTHRNTEVAYYRLKQIDTDSAFSYSPTRYVDKGIDVLEFSVYPNPSNQDVTLDLGDYQGEINLKVTNSEGKILLQRAGYLNEVNKSLNQFLAQGQNGTYILLIDTLDGSYQSFKEKLIKQ